MKSLKDMVVVISGGTRGIGLAIGERIAADGGKVALLGKTMTPHPVLAGTLGTAAAAIEAAGGEALPIQTDVRHEDQIAKAVKQVVDKWGRVDMVINNASAISLTSTSKTSAKAWDLMHSVNTRGTFLLTQHCLPHLKASPHAHVLTLSPPLSMDPKWFAPVRFKFSLIVSRFSSKQKNLIFCSSSMEHIRYRNMACLCCR